MRLDDGRWVYAAGVDREWRRVCGLRVKAALVTLRRVRVLLGRAPGSLAPFRLEESIAAFLRGPAAARDRLAAFPAFDAWLSLSETFLAGERPAGDWEAHFPFFQSFAAAAALLSGTTRRLSVRLTPEGRFHATGTREYFELPRALGGRAAVFEARSGSARVSLNGREAARLLLPAVTEDLWVERRDPLVLQPIYIHGRAEQDARAEKEYVRVLAAAMARIRRFEPPLYDEMSDFLRLLVPLANPARHGSVSSSYQNLRGALCLSHSEDILLQEETLIHEFAHQKINLLCAADPLLAPGQSGQVFYSPLRPDPRRLRGLLLGAHAFLKVNRYLLRALLEPGLSARERDSVRLNIYRRLIQVDDMLRTVSGYATLTPFGARLQARMWRELLLLYHATAGFPAEVVEAARLRCREHRLKYALGETGFHNGKDGRRGR